MPWRQSPHSIHVPEAVRPCPRFYVPSFCGVVLELVVVLVAVFCRLHRRELGRPRTEGTHGRAPPEDISHLATSSVGLRVTSEEAFALPVSRKCHLLEIPANVVGNSNCLMLVGSEGGSRWEGCPYASCLSNCTLLRMSRLTRRDARVRVRGPMWLSHTQPLAHESVCDSHTLFGACAR